MRVEVEGACSIRPDSMRGLGSYPDVGLAVAKIAVENLRVALREDPPVAHCAPIHSAAGQSGASPATARSAMHRISASELPPLDKTLPFSSASR